MSQKSKQSKGRKSITRKSIRQKGSCSKCICPNCGTEIFHKRGIPCFEEKCPKCGISMERAKQQRAKREIGIS